MGLIDDRLDSFKAEEFYGSTPTFRTIAYYSGSLPEWHGLVRATFLTGPDDEEGRWVCIPARTGLEGDEDERPLSGRLTGVREKSLAPLLVVDKWSSACSLCGAYDMYATDARTEELRARLLEGRRNECNRHGRFAFAVSPYGEKLFQDRQDWEGITVLPHAITVSRRWD